MSAMRDALETVITNANAATAANVAPGWQRGYVWVTGLALGLSERDLFQGNAWGTDPWDACLTGNRAKLDQTAMGLVVRLLQAGVMVRIMVWAPTGFQQKVVGVAHFLDHSSGGQDTWSTGRTGSQQGRAIPGVSWPSTPAPPRSGPESHHQKMMVIRSPQTPTTSAMDVAFVGGVAFAYTRRSDLDYALPFPSGDWQSGQTIPNPTPVVAAPGSGCGGGGRRLQLPGHRPRDCPGRQAGDRPARERLRRLQHTGGPPAVA